jgi:yecA family protein
MVRGNDWANSFMRGMEMRREAWTEAMQDDQECAPLIPILALAYENDPDPALRSYKKPVGNKTSRKVDCGRCRGFAVRVRETALAGG